MLAGAPMHAHRAALLRHKDVDAVRGPHSGYRCLHGGRPGRGLQLCGGWRGGGAAIGDHYVHRAESRVRWRLHVDLGVTWKSGDDVEPAT